MIIAIQDQIDKEGYWICELISLDIEPRRKNELNDVGELKALTNSLKETYYQDYKIAYGVNDIETRDPFHYQT